MLFDFETPVDRAGIGNMKDTLGPKEGDAGSFVVLSGAEIDYPTAPVLRQALAEFAGRGVYGYTLPDERYKNAVIAWMKKVRGFSVGPEEIVPTMGTIFALNTAVRAFTNPGDGVIVQHPSYYRYDVGIKRNDRNVVSNPLIEKNGRYTTDFADLEEKMADPANKLFVLCNPHNPTGKVFDEGELKQIAALARQHGVIVFADEIFAEITFGGHVAHPYKDIGGDHAVVSTSLGKVFSCTGVSQANVFIQNKTLREVYLAQRGQDHFGSIDPFFYTSVLAGYTDEGYAWVQAMKEHTWGNYRLIQDFLAENLPYITVSPLQGCYVIWVDFRRLGLTDGQLQAFLEEEAHIIGDPGEEYLAGGSGFYRFCIATPRARIQAFLSQLQRACEQRGF